jgi:uncharacterized protein (DUF2252 family)
MPIHLSNRHSSVDRTTSSQTQATETLKPAALPPPPGDNRTAPATDVLMPASRSRADEVKKCLIADNQAAILSNPAGAKEKFQKLTTSPFVFFRGTAGLFYRDLKGTDEKMPKVLCNGDVHPENFGAIRGADGKTFFGLNDFDECAPAPFTYDLRRGATAFELAARDNGIAKDQREKIVKAFLQGYSDGIQGFVGNDGKGKPQIDQKNAPKVVQKLLEKADKQKREGFLQARVDLKSGKFLSTSEIKPLPARVPEFKAALEGYAQSLGLPKGSLKIKDVAAKLESGTASLGTERYYVLVEGKSQKPGDERILEVKEENPAILESYFGTDPRAAAERVVAGEQTQSPGGDPYYGAIKLGGKSFLVRERSPHKAGVDLASLKADDMTDYARACGAALAQAHARSGKSNGLAREKDIAHELGKGLDKQIARFAQDEADRVTGDFGALTQLLQSGEIKFPGA